MKVTAADLRALLQSGAGTNLVLEGGQVLVVPPGQAAEHEGALTVASWEDVRRRLGDDAQDERALQEQAEILTTEITELGA
ncbi:hypothetical protein LWP59_10240 [Amycolatopsis acidiphila]|uniref:Uncharacterized protein n=1 Tax=Amycolatopsis acidiphila TaxID=715473 RepID=A0A557ZYL1_9PSEU|nr:hypothetical protein [Amycolatopsis acidiphila]TVT17108.1 hypothetical protein FNH06_32755 [Amycolatopsis acidiphila]UIJ63811.1 hypothetical protein LWP59_10240 [Amycolatopsis acidiphila]